MPLDHLVRGHESVEQLIALMPVGSATRPYRYQVMAA
jgi:hypothetical protein